MSEKEKERVKIWQHWIINLHSSDSHMQLLWLSSVFVIIKWIFCWKHFSSLKTLISLFSVNLLTFCTWMLLVCAIWIQLFVVKCAFLFFAMCLSFWRWGSLEMWHCVIRWIFPDVSEDCGSSSGSRSQRRLISSWPAWPWRCRVVLIQWQAQHSRRLTSLAAPLWERQIAHVEIWHFSYALVNL